MTVLTVISVEIAADARSKRQVEPRLERLSGLSSCQSENQQIESQS